MAFYTMLLRDICIEQAGQTGPYSTVIPLAQPKIFDFQYPAPTAGITKNELEQGFLKHFYMQEIGLETYDLWKLYLDSRFNEIMPYYCKLFEALAEEYDFLNPTDITTTTQEEGTSENTEDTTDTKTLTLNTQTQRNDSTTNTGNTTTSDESNYQTTQSELPQGQLTDFLDNTYLTRVERGTGSNSGTVQDETEGTLNSNTANTGTEKTDGSGTSTSNGSMTRDVSTTRTGRDGYDASKLLESYMKAQRKLLTQFYNDCQNLFMQVWRFDWAPDGCDWEV